MNDSDLQELLDKVVAGRLTPEDERWNALLAERPELEEELALAAALRSLPQPPAISSNFTSRVMQAIRRDEAAEQRTSRLGWFRWPNLIRIGATAAVIGMLAFTYVNQREVKQAQQAAESFAASVKDLEAENALSVFRDFEAIRQLPPNTPGVDDAFLSALAK